MTNISIIVPVYNAEKYLHRCIDSILNQTFSDFELILVNDGSNDESGRICDEYATKDDRIRVIHKNNGGVSKARNTGIDNSNGNFITFVDSDDYIDEHMLQKMYDDINKYDNVDLVISSLKMINSDAVVDYCIPDSVHTNRSLMEGYGLESFPRICLCSPWCKLYKSDVIKSNNIYFNSSLSLGEDFCFNLHYLQHCKKIVSSADTLYMYSRENEDSLYSKFRDFYYSNIVIVQRETEKAMKVLNCSEDSVARQIQGYISDIVANLVKAVRTTDRKTCIKYMVEIRYDSALKEHINDLKNNPQKYLIIKLVQCGLYGLVYCLLTMKYKFIKVHK